MRARGVHVQCTCCMHERARGARVECLCLRARCPRSVLCTCLMRAHGTRVQYTCCMRAFSIRVVCAHVVRAFSISVVCTPVMCAFSTCIVCAPVYVLPYWSESCCAPKVVGGGGVFVTAKTGEKPQFFIVNRPDSCWPSPKRAPEFEVKPPTTFGPIRYMRARVMCT